MAGHTRVDDYALAAQAPTRGAPRPFNDRRLYSLHYQLRRLDLRLVWRKLSGSETHYSFAAFFGDSDLLWRAQAKVDLLSPVSNLRLLHAISNRGRAACAISISESGARFVSSRLLTR